ncbi:MAG: hypothetical protein V2A54_18130 [Bacteroidota bacterium]
MFQLTFIFRFIFILVLIQPALILSALAQSPVIFWKTDTGKYVNQSINTLYANQEAIFLLGTASDKSETSARMSLTRLSLKGKLQITTLINDVAGFVSGTKILPVNEQLIRIFGTAVNDNKVKIPYINTVSIDFSNSVQNSIFIVNPTIMGDAVPFSDRDCIWAKSVQSSTTKLSNIYVYRSDRFDIDRFRWRLHIESAFHEECRKLIVLPDSNILLLARRLVPSQRDTGIGSYRSVIYKLSPSGKMIWNKEIPFVENFYEQDICFHSDSSFLLSFSYGATSNTMVFQLDTAGNTKRVVRIDSILTNGILPLSNGEFALYGSDLKQTSNGILNRGKILILKQNMEVFWKYEMKPTDKPDSEMTGILSGSDFKAAFELPNGSIACAGSVYMPDDTKAGFATSKSWSNRNFLVFFQLKTRK